MSAGGQDSVVSRQSARRVVALGLVLLSVTVAGVTLGGVTAAESQSGPIEVSDWTDLDDIRNDTDADYMLVNDLNETTPGYETVAGPNANGGKGFDPIGGFSGSFDGQGNTIADLTINRPTEDQVGLFGNTSGDAVIDEVIITGATVNGSQFVGGLVGDNEGTVSNASASGTVTGSGFAAVGGLVGANRFGGTVSTASASGAVTGSVDVGGLVGGNSGTVSTASASGAVTGSRSVGGLVGSNYRGMVSTASASGNVTGSERVGGLVGRNRRGTVSNASASGAVIGSIGSFRVGGLVGDNAGTVSSSSASGAVNGSDDVGGLVGGNFEGTVSESFATGAVTGSSDVGGLVGQLGFESLRSREEAILRDSYYDTQTTGQQAAVGFVEEGDGTAERRGEVTGLSTSQMQGASAAQNMGALDFTSTWRVVTGPPGYPELRSLSDGPDPEPPLTAGFTITPEDPTAGEQLTLDAAPSIPESDIEGYDWTLGDGTTATGKQVTHTYTDPGQFTVELTVQNSTETDTTTETVSVSPPSSSVEISDWTDLDNIRNNLDADYVLVTDLNETTPGYETVAGPNANGGKGFAPIGGFNGSFNGQGNTIDELTIARPNENKVGLFGDTSGSAAIEEVRLTSATVTGPMSVGGLVGSNEGTVSTASASGAVNGSDNVGGLVGRNRGTVSTSSASGAVNGSDNVGGLVGTNLFGTVRNSSASGTVNGSGFVGGLVGQNFEGTVSNASASGAVNATDSFGNVGGLVGFNRGTVSTSSASGAVNGSDNVGGLVGFNRGTVSNASASGAVNATDSFGNVGGLVGDNVEGTVSESFATGAVTGSFSAGGLVGRLGGGLLDPRDEAILRDSYYDTQTTGQQAAVGFVEEGDGTAERRGEVTGLSTSQMQGVSAAQNMTALDFTSTWRVVTDPPEYPELSTVPTLGRNPPRDVDADGLYEDVRGDGTFDLRDVQSLFNNLNNPALQNNAETFTFQESSGSDAVTVLDVQMLFNELPE